MLFVCHCILLLRFICCFACQSFSIVGRTSGNQALDAFAQRWSSVDNDMSSVSIPSNEPPQLAAPAPTPVGEPKDEGHLDTKPNAGDDSKKPKGVAAEAKKKGTSKRKAEPSTPEAAYI